jgi:tetratricopeptide (TPR) repeat protein
VRRLIVAALCASGIAAADPAADAKRLFEEGRVLYDAKKYLEACVLFEKSFQLDPAVGTKLNLAECAERDGKPRKAWRLWVEAAEEFDKVAGKASQATFARKRADELAPKLATVVVQIAKPGRKGLEVAVGERTVAPAPRIVERGEPGEVTVKVSAPGRKSFTTTVQAELGREVVVEVPPLPSTAATDPDPEPTEPTTEPSTSTRAWKIVGISGLVITAVGVGAVAYFYSQKQRYESGECASIPSCGNTTVTQRDADGNSAATNANIGEGLVIGGVALVVIGGIKLLLAHDDKPKTTSRIDVVPVHGGAGISVRW